MESFKKAIKKRNKVSWETGETKQRYKLIKSKRGWLSIAMGITFASMGIVGGGLHVSADTNSQVVSVDVKAANQDNAPVAGDGVNSNQVNLSKSSAKDDTKNENDTSKTTETNPETAPQNEVKAQEQPTSELTNEVQDNSEPAKTQTTDENKSEQSQPNSTDEVKNDDDSSNQMPSNNDKDSNDLVKLYSGVYADTTSNQAECQQEIDVVAQALNNQIDITKGITDNDKQAFINQINTLATEGKNQLGNDNDNNTKVFNETNLKMQDVCLGVSTALQNSNGVLVTNADEFYNALANGDKHDIIIGNDIDLANLVNKPSSQGIGISNKIANGDVNISSMYNKYYQYSVDFDAYTFSGNNDRSNKNLTNVNFTNLYLFGTNLYGPIANASSYTFDNVQYLGAQAVYSPDTSTAAGAQVTIKNTVILETVNQYQTNFSTQTKYINDSNNNTGKYNVEQAIEANNIVFAENSNFTGTTYSGNVLELAGSANSSITLCKGSTVNLYPHGTSSVQNEVNGAAYGIVLKGKIILDDGSALNIFSQRGDIDSAIAGNQVAGAIALVRNGSNQIEIGNNANINVYTKNQPKSSPIYIEDNSPSKSQIIINNGGSFNYNGSGLGNYSGSIIQNPAGYTYNINLSDSGKFSLDALSGTNAKLTPKDTIVADNVKIQLSDGSYSAPIDHLIISFDKDDVTASFTGVSSEEGKVISTYLNNNGNKLQKLVLFGALQDAKDAASKVIDKAASDAKTSIDNESNLAPSEKQKSSR